jgi:hypothetical protein
MTMIRHFAAMHSKVQRYQHRKRKMVPQIQLPVIGGVNVTPEMLAEKWWFTFIA